MSESTPRRRWFRLMVWALLVGSAAALLYSVYAPSGALDNEPQYYWSPFTARPAITFILVFCLIWLGGSALLTWFVMRPKG